MHRKLALITGATSGIGAATAREFARIGYDLILTGRRESRLRDQAAELETQNKIKVTTLAFDLSDRHATEKALNSIDLTALTVLVNNAGLALGTDSMPQAKLDDWDTMIDTNVKGLLYVTRLTLAALTKNAGHIVNIGSVAGRWTYPGGGVYSATKFAVRALSEGLRLDLMGTGVRVTNIEPGMVETEFSEVRFGGDTSRAKNVYRGMTPLSSEDIAETIIWCVARPKHVNIQELVIYPTDQAGVGPVYTHRRTENENSKS